ncbi:MAG: glycosyltransferase [Methylococcales bacterium]
MVYLFFISIVLIIYTFVGYPLIVYLLSLKLKNNVQINSPNSVKHYDLTILMVVCNEENQIETKLINLLNLSYFSKKPKIVIVDDNSDDSTVEIIKKINSERIDLLNAPHRLGKANGINMAMEVITTPLVLLVDVRQEVANDAAEKLCKWFEMDQNVGAMSGELHFKSDNNNDFSKGMDGYWRYEKFIRKMEANISSVPGVTGAIYMLRRSTYIPIQQDTILDDVLIPMNVIKQGYTVGFDDEAVAWDVPSYDPIKEKRRKVRTIKGNYQLLIRFYHWVLPFGHPIWLQFLSHKILRIFVPFFALLHIVSATYLAVYVNQLWFIYVFLMILSILILPTSIIFKSIASIRIIRLWLSFLTLNWYSFLAFFSYFFGETNSSWKK